MQQLPDRIGCRLWIAFEPDRASQPDTVLAMLNSMAVALPEFTLSVSPLDDTRTYQMTTRGLNALERALRRDPRQRLSILSGVITTLDGRRLIAFQGDLPGLVVYRWIEESTRSGATNPLPQFDPGPAWWAAMFGLGAVGGAAGFGRIVGGFSLGNGQFFLHSSMRFRARLAYTVPE